jgi:hypothetical protein
MTTNAIPFRQRVYNEVIGDLINLIMAQPHQALISSASVAIVASEAVSLVPQPFNVLMAVGAEWAYLRGIASSGKGDKGWVTALNWGALFLVVLYGMLWGARKFGALAATPDPTAAWILTAVHILPVAFLSLAAAMVHRSAAAIEEAERQRRASLELARQEDMQRQRDALALEAERKEQDLTYWVKAQEAKAAARLSTAQVSRSVTQTAPSASPSDVDTIRARAVDILKDTPNITKTELAARLSVSRAYLYKHGLDRLVHQDAENG